MPPYRILVTGSREWKDLPAVSRELGAIRKRVGMDRSIVVVHGAADGLDITAAFAATVLHMTPEPHPADWGTHGKGAGPIRNQAMVDLGADICLAFPLPRSVGTWDCIRRANAAGIRTIIIPPRQEQR